MVTSKDKIDKINVCHLITGDIWGGAEAQVFSLLCNLNQEKSLSINVIVFNNGILADKLLEEKIETDILNESKYNDLSILFRIFSLIKKTKPHIIHCHGFKENFLGGIVSRILNIKLVRTHHGKGMLDADRIHRAIEWINGKFFTTKQISVSNELNSILIQRGFEQNKISVIHNGIKCKPHSALDSDLHIRNELGIGENVYVIGTVGRLVPIKGHKYYIDAASIILKNKINIVFLILGDGELMNELKDYVRLKNIEKNVIFAGFKSNVLEYIHLMNIFVLPSLHEGIPIVLLEAMCLKKAIIASDVGGIPEVISSNVDGLLVKPADPIALAEAITRLIENPGINVMISRNAHERMKMNFTIEKTTFLTNMEYISLISKKRLIS